MNHIAVGCRDQRTYVGHLEDESVVLYLAEVLIMRLDDMGLRREMDPRYDVALLKGRS